jgi:hypothetical protein
VLVEVGSLPQPEEGEGEEVVEVEEEEVVVEVLLRLLDLMEEVPVQSFLAPN